MTKTSEPNPTTSLFDRPIFQEGLRMCLPIDIIKELAEDTSTFALNRKTGKPTGLMFASDSGVLHVVTGYFSDLDDEGIQKYIAQYLYEFEKSLAEGDGS